MPEIVVKVKAKDLMSSVFRGMGKTVKSVTTRMTNSLRSVGRALTSFKGLLVGAIAVGGVIKLARGFFEVAQFIDTANARLKVLLKSQAKANSMMKVFRDYAAKVPFEIGSVIKAGIVLTKVMGGNVDKVKFWLQGIGNLAAATGFSLEDATREVVKMMSSGKAAAERFRDDSTLAWLGFTGDVEWSAEQTKKRLIELMSSSTSVIAGGTAALANTITGKMSMIKDAWFQLQEGILKANVGKAMKLVLDAIIEKIADLKKKGELKNFMKDTALVIITSMEIATHAVEAFANSFSSIEWAILGMGKIYAKVVGEIKIGFFEMTKAGSDAFSFLGGQHEKNASDAAMKIMMLKQRLKETMKTATDAMNLLEQKMNKVGTSFEDFRKQLRDIQKDAEKAIDKSKELSGVKTPKGSSSESRRLSEMIAKRIKLNALELETLAIQKRKNMAASKATIEKLIFQAKELDVLNQMAKAEEKRVQVLRTIRDFYFMIGDALTDYVMGAIDMIGKKQRNWNALLNETLKDLAKTAIKSTIRLALNAFIGAEEGGVFKGGLGNRMPLRKYAGGGITDGPEVALIGEGSADEAVIPMKNGKVPVSLTGGGGNSLTFNINAIDARGVSQMLIDNSETIKSMLMQIGSENPEVVMAFSGNF